MSNNVLWEPTPDQIQHSAMTLFSQEASVRSKKSISNYQELWQWSVDDRASFWDLVWDFCGVVGEKGQGLFLEHSDDMINTRWFPNSRLNYAQNLLKRCDNDPEKEAVIFWGEDKVKERLSHKNLQAQVSQCAQGLSALGVVKGDRVAGFLPNIPQALIAMLATTSLGAIWTSASPDFGVKAILDRFGQTLPKVMLCTDGYWYNGKGYDCMEKNKEIAAGISSLCKTILVPYLNPACGAESLHNGVLYQDFLVPYSGEKPVFYEEVEFNHPLFIMYSSGTTGVPKCIVHGHGGTLLQHLKEHRLHGNLGENNKIFFFSTCSWMMWNWHMTALATGATLILYDGAPSCNTGNILFDLVDAEKITHFGVGAKFIDSIAKMGLKPKKTHQLKDLQVIYSTGSPLMSESFNYIYDSVSSRVRLSSISGGTDILSCFALGNPNLPVYCGEIQSRGLGMAVYVFDDEGKALEQGKGELVCTRSFPAQPVGFWNDPEKAKYRSAYFEAWPNVWCHGDFVELTQHGGMIIFGRSDATLNPGGVRIGTAEIYRQVESLSEIEESLVVGQDWQNDVRVVLFVKLCDGFTLTDDLIKKIKSRIAANATTRHVPAKVIQVADIPRTKNGKLVELAVRNVIHHRPVKNVDSLANPKALELFKDLKELAV